MPGPAATRARRGGWWRAWRARFGLAEVCGTLAALIGNAGGYPAPVVKLGKRAPSAAPATPMPAASALAA